MYAHTTLRAQKFTARVPRLVRIARMILDRFRLDGQVAIVTGAGRGIGRGIACAFAEAGADVVLAARSVDELEASAARVREAGRRALVVRCDVMQRADLENLLRASFEEFGRLDTLVNNAGGSAPKPALHTSEREFEHALRFNVTSAFLLTRLAAARIVESAGGGSVLNISSVAGRAHAPGFVAYGTAKAALSFMTGALAQDFAPKIRVNAIAVGAVRTSALETVLTPEVEREMVAATPLGCLGEVEDIAACALWLASPAARYVSGEVVGVTGGLAGLNMTLPRAFA